MKKILSVTLAIIMLLSVMMVAIPATAATPIEAIPYSNWSINGEHFGNMQKNIDKHARFYNYTRCFNRTLGHIDNAFC